jgi:hypothetical protein
VPDTTTWKLFAKATGGLIVNAEISGVPGEGVLRIPPVADVVDQPAVNIRGWGLHIDAEL